MSLYCKQDLSGKTSKELVSLKTELNAQLSDLSVKKCNLNNEGCIDEKQYEDIDKDIKHILKEIKRIVEKQYKDVEKDIIKLILKEIEYFELLSEDELSVITKKMDTTNYIPYRVLIRFQDLERICREVIEIKKQYPRWILTDLARIGEYDILPPQVFYRYEYKDEYGSYFAIE